VLPGYAGRLQVRTRCVRWRRNTSDRVRLHRVRLRADQHDGSGLPLDAPLPNVLELRRTRCRRGHDERSFRSGTFGTGYSSKIASAFATVTARVSQTSSVSRSRHARIRSATVRGTDNPRASSTRSTPPLFLRLFPLHGLQLCLLRGLQLCLLHGLAERIGGRTRSGTRSSES
jgi:hypothetical protein